MKKQFLCIVMALSGVFAITTAQAQTPISSATLTVNDTAIAPTSVSASPTAICTGSSTDLSITGGETGTGGQWQWYEGSCGGTLVTTAPDGSATVSPTNSGTEPITVTYYLQSVGASCGASICKSVTVTVNPVPVANSITNVTYCNSATTSPISLTGTPSSGLTFDVLHSASIGASNATGVTSIPSFTATNSGTAPIIDTVSIIPLANGCSGDTVRFTITVNPTATVNAVADQTKCNNTSTDAITFSSPTTGGTITYNWTNDKPGIGLAASGSGDIAAFTATNTSCTNDTATITVTPSYNNGGQDCDGTPITFKIVVRPSPNGSIALATTPICEGQTAQLTYTSSCSGSTGPFDLEINQDGGSNTLYNNEASGTPFDVNPAEPTSGSHTFNLMKITDANGCVREAQ